MSNILQPIIFALLSLSYLLLVFQEERMRKKYEKRIAEMDLFFSTQIRDLSNEMEQHHQWTLQKLGDSLKTNAKLKYNYRELVNQTLHKKISEQDVSPRTIDALMDVLNELNNKWDSIETPPLPEKKS